MKSKSKRSALFLSSKKAAQRCVSHVCLLIFAFCLLISPVRSQTKEQVNLNTASVTELIRVPYIGQAIANRILEHRRRHGNFKRPQDLIIIKGFSAKRYRQIAHLIRI
jgi:DNA uptake protein ComE-like DNA-binding protein